MDISEWQHVISFLRCRSGAILRTLQKVSDCECKEEIHVTQQWAHIQLIQSLHQNVFTQYKSILSFSYIYILTHANDASFSDFFYVSHSYLLSKHVLIKDNLNTNSSVNNTGNGLWPLLFTSYVQSILRNFKEKNPRARNNAIALSPNPHSVQNFVKYEWWYL